MKNKKDEAPQQNTTETQGTLVLLEKKHINPFKRSRGSGFFIAPDKIATNIHVVTGTGTLTAKCVDTNTVYTIEGIVAFDDINDIVILKIAEKGIPFPLGDSNTVQRGDKVCAIGHSARKKLIEFRWYKLFVSLSFVSKSEKSKVEGTVHAVQNNGKRMKFNLPDAEQGYSGGPVLNSKGEVIAILFQGTGVLGESISSINRLTAISVNRLKEILTNAEQAEVDTSVIHSTEDASQETITATPLQVESIARWQRRPRIRAYTQLNRGNTKSSMGNPKRAITAYNKAIELNSDLTDVFINRGAAKGDLGDFEGAIEDFNAAIRVNPEDVSAYDNRGKAKIALENPKGAIEDYDIVIRLDPEMVEAYYNRGVAKEELGDTKGAIEDYDMVIHLNPEDADFYYIRGIAKGELGDFAGAIEDYDNAIRLNSEDADFYYNRAIAKKALGDTKGAIEDYDMAIKLNPNFTSAYYNRGNAKKVLGDTKGAIEDYDMAIKLNPNFTSAYYNRGNAKKVLGEQEEAEADFAKAKKLKQD